MKCPCIARVCRDGEERLSSESHGGITHSNTDKHDIKSPLSKTLYLRLPCMELHDCNEKEHYSRIVYDYDVVNCCNECCKGNALVDCALKCSDKMVGIEFKGLCKEVMRIDGQRDKDLSEELCRYITEKSEQKKKVGCGLAVDNIAVIFVSSHLYWYMFALKCFNKEVKIVSLRNICNVTSNLCEGGIFFAKL